MWSALLILAGLAGLLVGAELLVRGSTALASRLGIRPITFERPTLRFDLPAMTAASLALWLLALDGSLTRVDGIVLCLAGVAYTLGITILVALPRS
jgi:cation:H+ antiporter